MHIVIHFPEELGLAAGLTDQIPLEGEREGGKKEGREGGREGQVWSKKRLRDISANCSVNSWILIETN